MNQSLLPPGYGADTWQNLAVRLTHLRNIGFNPISILDVGAHHGHWAVLVKWIWPTANLFLIEANEECRQRLTEVGFPFNIAVLGRQVNKTVFHKCQTGCTEGNSLFKENSIFPFITVDIETKMLKTVVEDRAFDFVKIDCQGAELDIIAGGEEIVKAAHVVLLETQIQDYNEGAPRAADVIARMSGLGFRLYDMVELHYNSRGMLLQMDLMFAREDSPLFRVRPLS